MIKSSSLPTPSGTLVFFSPLFVASLVQGTDVVSGSLATEEQAVEWIRLGVMGIVTICDDWGHTWLECNLRRANTPSIIPPGLQTSKMSIAVGGGKIVFRDLTELYLWNSDFAQDAIFEIDDGFYAAEVAVQREYSRIEDTNEMRLDITLFFECQPTSGPVQCNIERIPDFSKDQFQ